MHLQVYAREGGWLLYVLRVLCERRVDRRGVSASRPAALTCRRHVLDVWFACGRGPFLVVQCAVGVYSVYGYGCVRAHASSPHSHGCRPTGAAVCFCISVVSPNVAFGNLVGIIILLFSILFEGILVNQASIPKWLTPIRYASFVGYGTVVVGSRCWRVPLCLCVRVRSI